MEIMVTGQSFWKNKQVLVTGHTGFKGCWLLLLLRRLGANVIGASLPPMSKPNLFELLEFENDVEHHLIDIRNRKALAGIAEQSQPEIIFHLAAQPLVRASYLDPLETFSINVQGTANVLDITRDLRSAKVFIAITTDKVYRSNNNLYPYREVDPLGGHDPYSASKAAAEMVVSCYRDAFLKERGVAVASARTGNVIGGGDWSDDRLIPDAVRTWSDKKPLVVRSPDSIRPWQHVLEPLHGYVALAEKLWQMPELAGAFNFGPPPHDSATVRDVVRSARSVYEAGEVRWHSCTPGPYEAPWLSLEVTKSRRLLNVHSYWGLHESIVRTMRWYKRHANGENAKDLCEEDIAAYQAVLDDRLSAP